MSDRDLQWAVDVPGSAETVTKITTVAAVLLPAAAVWMRAVSFWLSSASIPGSTALALPIDQLALQGLIPVAPAVAVAAAGTFLGRRMARWLRNIPIHNWELPATVPSWRRVYPRNGFLAAASSLIGTISAVIADRTNEWLSASVATILLLIAASLWATMAAYQVESRSHDPRVARAHTRVRAYRREVANAERQLELAVESFKAGSTDVDHLLERLLTAERELEKKQDAMNDLIERERLSFGWDAWACGYWSLVLANAALALWAMIVGLPASVAIIVSLYVLILACIAVWMARPDNPSNWELAGGMTVAVVLAATVFGVIPIHHARMELETAQDPDAAAAVMIGEDDRYFFGWSCPASAAPPLEAIARSRVVGWSREGTGFRLGWSYVAGKEPTLQSLWQTATLLPVGLDPEC